MRAYAVCIRVTPECRWTESEMIRDGRGHADKADEVYHDNQDLSFADLDELSTLSFEIFLPQSQQGGSWGNDKSIAGSSQGSRHGKNKRKHTGSASEYPICCDFNRSSGCKQTDCCFLHKCSNCSSSSHPECHCPRKLKEEVHE